jgi:hypothetical protein
MRAFAILSAVLIAGSAASGHAMEPDAVFSRYKAMWQQFGMSAQFGAAEPQGSDGVTFRDVTLQQPGKAALKLDRLTLKGIAPLGSDGFTAQSFEMGQVSLDATDEQGRTVAMRIEGGSGTGLYLPPTGSTEPMVSTTMPSNMAIGRITATVDGAPAFTVSGITGSVGYDAGGQAIQLSTAIPQIDISMDQATPKMRAQLATAGLTGLALSVNVRGSWNVQTGRVALDEYRLGIKDAGAVNLSLALEGYTPQLSQQIRELTRKREAIDSNDVEAKKQVSDEMMAALGKLRLASARLAFEDGAVTRRLLATQAEAMGITTEELAAGLPTMLAGYLAMAGNQQFADQAVSALGAFLANPRNLTLSVGPAQPLPITRLVEAILNAPDQLVPLLGASVTANQ